MIKDLVVHLSSGGPDTAGPFAMSVAETFGAHLAGIAFSYDPVIPPTLMGTVPVSFIESQRAEHDQAAKDAVARFEAATRHAGVPAQARILSASLAGSAERFAATARRFDLAVVGQGEPDQPAVEELVVEAALFSSGRPVLVVPYIQKAPLTLDRVMVCWDASRSAARAIADAMPLLARAGTVEVVIVANERVKSDEIPGADIGQHLARHGLAVEVRRIVAADSDVASTLLSHAADMSADFMVMGGYGHSRLREFILGGATRGILAAMTLPTLMSH